MTIIGVSHLDFNEDDVRALAQDVRTFADGVTSTHASATVAVANMGLILSGSSYEVWAEVASRVEQLDRACKGMARSLDDAADLAAAVKVVVLAELNKMAVDHAGVMASPMTEPCGLAVSEIARKLCEGTEELLVSYLVEEVIGKVIGPLDDSVLRLVMDIPVYVGHALGALPDRSTSPRIQAEPGLHAELAELLHCEKMLDDLAGDILEHSATFANGVARLHFTTRPPRGPGNP
ncbi:hypothetical protein ACWEKR_24740 [Nocardia sp. NPDC004573]